MQSLQQNPFKYKNGKTEIESNIEKPHHIKMMWFDLIMKWFVRTLWPIIIAFLVHIYNN